MPRAIHAAARTAAAHEIIVVDGGSTDRTPAQASALGGRVLASGATQRAAQLNLGAAAARGEVLLFLHADTALPERALERILQALVDGSVGGGGFARRFDSPSPFLQLTCVLAELRNRTVGWHLGDQALFVRRSLFAQLGGFRRVDRFEDLDFSRRLGRIARVATLRPPVVSSARRFARRGPVGQTARDFVLTLRYLWGDPAALEREVLSGANARR